MRKRAESETSVAQTLGAEVSSASPTKDIILDAAERVFAANGYSGSSMKMVALAARVAQSLLHYHFGTKDRLFEEMFKRRSIEMNTERLRTLTAVMSGSAPTLEAVVETLLMPLVKVRGANEGNFSRLIIRVSVDDGEKCKALVKENFDSMARCFIDALKQVLPGLTEEEAVWGYLFSIGVAMTMMAPTARANRLSNNLCDDEDVVPLMARITRYACAGLRALADDSAAAAVVGAGVTIAPVKRRTVKSAKAAKSR